MSRGKYSELTTAILLTGSNPVVMMIAKAAVLIAVATATMRIQNQI